MGVWPAALAAAPTTHRDAIRQNASNVTKIFRFIHILLFIRIYAMGRKALHFIRFGMKCERHMPFFTLSS